MHQEWYAVKGLFRWATKSDDATVSVEERVVLFRAESFDHAIKLAEQEAIRYCAEDGRANFFIEVMNWWDAYLIGDEDIASGVEVYSRLMDTALSSDAFLRRYRPKSQIHKERQR